jgi:hypothetical protein
MALYGHIKCYHKNHVHTQNQFAIFSEIGWEKFIIENSDISPKYQINLINERIISLQALVIIILASSYIYRSRMIMQMNDTYPYKSNNPTNNSKKNIFR